MVKVIMGVKGSGKTKLLIDLVQKALDGEQGALNRISRYPTLSSVCMLTTTKLYSGSWTVSPGFRAETSASGSSI